MEKSKVIKDLEKKFGFVIEQSPTDKFIDFIVFDNGQKYRLQHPTFMELHNLFTESDNVDHSLFRWGLKNLFPDSEGTPKIDEKWLEANRKKGLTLWSPLIRNRLLSE